MGAIERRQAGYSEQQVKEILARAMDLPEQRGEAFSRAQMAQLAEELGITEGQLAEAEQAWLAEQREGELSQQHKAFIASRRREMRNGIAGYAVMGGLLAVGFALDIAILSMFSSFLLVPMFIIAIILFFGTWEAIFEVEGEDFDKEFAKWQERRQKQLALIPPPKGALPARPSPSEE